MGKRVFLAEYTSDQILPLLGYGKGKEEFRLPNGKSYMVKVGTARLECLRRNQACVWCERVGNFFVLEASGNPTPHLNLYHRGKDGMIMMTQDHILPVAWNGTDDVENLQTMCAKCNQAKGTLTPLQFVCKMTQWPLAKMMEKIEGRLVNGG
jgi:HNH endonuclease